MIQPNITPKEIEDTLNQYLEHDDFMNQLGARVLHGTAKRGEWGWTVSVGTENDPPRMYEFSDRLGEVEDLYRQAHHIDLLIAPSGIKPSEMNK